MIIYNTQWLDALHTSREAKRWFSSNVISQEQYAALKAKFLTPFYAPNIFIRIVLFFFACFALSGVYGMAFLIVSAGGETARAVFCLVMGLGSLVALDVLVKQRHLHRSGIDEALLYTSLCFSIGGALWLYFAAAMDSTIWVIPWLLALPFLVWGALRFADRLVTAAAYVCCLGAIFTLMFEAGSGAKAFLPFAAMAVGLGTYFLTLHYKEKETLRPYKDCFFVLELLALATFYCGGNYYVVHEANALLLIVTMNEGPGMSFSWLFYFLTALTPIVYIVRGLMVRDHLLIRSGLIAAVLSVLTFRYYFHVLPPEVALTLGGLVLFLAAVIATRSLKDRTDGFTDKHLLKEKLKGLNAEAMLIGQTLGATPQAIPEKKFEGGGGKFGGGGAGGNW